MSSFICSYNGCLEIMLNLISEKPERYMIIVATHNEESVRRAVTRYTFINRSFHWQVIISIVKKISVYLYVVSVFQDGRVGASQRWKLCLFWSAAGHVWPCLSYSRWVSFYSVIQNEFISLPLWNTRQPSHSSSLLSPAWFLSVQVSAVRLSGRHTAISGAKGSGEPHCAPGNP